MALPSPEPLYEHLCALRDAEDVYHPRHEPRWRAVSRWLELAFPGHGAEGADRRQETLLSLLRSVGTMRAEGPLQAAKWVSTIHRRKHVDAIRAQHRDPVHDGLKNRPRDPSGPAPLEQVAADVEPHREPGALEALVDRVLGEVQLALEETVKSASKRLLRRRQAQAVLLRLVCGWDADAIEQALDLGEPVGKDRLYKWIERGRDPVRAGLDRWARRLDPEEREAQAPVFEALRELLDDRRADAGQPRADRRRDRSDGGT